MFFKVKSKSGQITVVLIISLILVVVVSAMYYTKEKILDARMAAPVSSSGKAAQDRILVDGFASRCLKKVLADGIEEIGLQGGVLYSGNPSSSQGGVTDPFPLAGRAVTYLNYDGRQVVYGINPTNRNRLDNFNQNLSEEKYLENYTILFLNFNAGLFGYDGEVENNTGVVDSTFSGRYNSAASFDGTDKLVFSSGLDLDDETFMLCHFENTFECVRDESGTLVNVAPGNITDLYFWIEAEDNESTTPPPEFSGPELSNSYGGESGGWALDVLTFSSYGATWNISPMIRTESGNFNLWARFGGTWTLENGIGPPPSIMEWFNERAIIHSGYTLSNLFPPLWSWNNVGNIPFNNNSFHELKLVKQATGVSGLDVLLLTRNFAFDPDVDCPAGPDFNAINCNTQASDFTPSFVSGKYGRGVDLDGSNDFLFYPVKHNIDIKQGTIQMWVRPDWNAGPNGLRYLWDMGNDTNSNRFAIFYGDPTGVAGNNLVFTIQDSESTSPFNEFSVSSPVVWNAGDWVHIAATWDKINSNTNNGEMHLYVNGEEVGTPVTSKLINVSQEPGIMFFGQNMKYQTAANSFDARIDDIKISNRPLSSQEILKLHWGNFNSEEGSVSFWINPAWDGDDGLGHSLFSSYNGQPVEFRKTAANRLELEFFASTYNIDVSGWRSGGWQKIAFTWNSTLTSLMIADGTYQTNTRAGAGDWPANLLIGNNRLGTETCDCILDDFVIRDYAMSYDDFYSNNTKRYYNSTPPNYPWWYDGNYFPYRANSGVPDFIGYYGEPVLVPITNSTDNDTSDEVYSIEYQLVRKIKNETNGVYACLNWSEFSSMGFAVETADPKDMVVSLNITDKRVTAMLNYEIFVRKNTSGISAINATGPSFYLNSISASVPVRLGKVYSFLEEVIEFDTEDISFIMNKTAKGGIIANLSLDVDFSYDDIILITDYNSSLKGMPFQFRFARKNRAPAIYYIEDSVLSSIPVGSDVTTAITLQGIDPDEDQVYFSTTPPLMPGVAGDKINISVNDSPSSLGVTMQALTDWQEFTVP